MEINDFHQKVYLVYTHANVVALVLSLILTKLCQIVNGAKLGDATVARAPQLLPLPESL